MPLVKKIEDKIRKNGTGDAFVNAILFILVLLLAAIGLMWIMDAHK
jgi:hypothetical protein